MEVGTEAGNDNRAHTNFDTLVKQLAYMYAATDWREIIAPYLPGSSTPSDFQAFRDLPSVFIWGLV